MGFCSTLLRDAGFMDLCAGFMDLSKDGDLGFPIMGAEIAGARSSDFQTSASQLDGEGISMPPR
jgi:hypothetical protein